MSFFLKCSVVFFLIIITPFYAVSLDYEPGTLLIKIKQEPLTGDTVSRKKNDDIKKMISVLNRKWAAREKELVLQNIVMTVYSSLVNVDQPENLDRIKVLSFPKEFDIAAIKRDYQDSGAVAEVEYNYYVYRTYFII